MKLKINFKKIISAFILIVVICSIYTGLSNSVYGKINENYSTGETVGNIDVDKAVDDSSILKAVASFIYAIAGLIEHIVASIMGALTGAEVFPWADRVIFNTMPFLDVNFLSPSEGSLFLDTSMKDTIFGTIIKNLYYTIFVLSVTFFGVVVGIMALRLAISSIAAEKAKYKQAITNWLLALILLFTAHYLISFIFFVNEKMVEVASSILKEQTKGIDVSIDVEKWTPEQCESMVRLFLESALKGITTEYFHDKYKDDFHITKVASYDGKKHYSIEMNDNKDDGAINNKEDAVRIKEYTPPNYPKTYDYDKTLQKELYYYTCMLLTDRTYMGYENDFVDFETKEGFASFLSGVQSFFGGNNNGEIAMSIFHDATYLLALNKAGNTNLTEVEFVVDFVYQSWSTGRKTGWSKENVFNALKEAEKTGNIDLTDIHMVNLAARARKLYSIYNNYIAVTATATENKDLLTNMSSFFRNSVYTFKYDKNGQIASATASQFQPIPAILYAIFVIQSIMYFIAYMKRFFYIIILALFAPLVIIYDFLTKTAMG